MPTSDLRLRIDRYADEPELDLSGCAIRHVDDAVHLASRLSSAPLVRLVLDDCQLTPEALGALAGATLPASLSALSLRMNQIDGPGVRALLGAAWIDQLEQLDLSGNRIDNDEIALLAEAPPARLRHLHLSANHFCPHGVQMLADSGLALETLSLYRCTVNNDGARAIAAAPHLAALTHLGLAHTAIDDHGAAALAEALHHVRVLDLAHNDLSDAGVKALARAPLTELERLDLTGNHVTSDGLLALCALDAPRLHALEIGGSSLMGGGGIAAAGVSGIADAPWRASLRELGLAGHLMGDAGALALGPLELPALERLDLRMNGIEDAGMIALADALGLPALALLDARVNAIGDEGARALASGAGLPGLRWVLLDDNRVGDAGARALTDARANPSRAQLEGVGLGANPISSACREALRGTPGLHL